MSTSQRITAGIALFGLAVLFSWSTIWHRSAGPRLDQGEAPSVSPAATEKDPSLSLGHRVPTEELPASHVHGDIDVGSQGQDCCLIGRVVDEEGKGVTGAKVMALRKTMGAGALPWTVGTSVTSSSEENGAYSIPVPAGQAYTVRAEYQDLRSEPQGPRFAGQSITLVLTAGRALRVQVLEKEPGGGQRSIEGALVNIGDRQQATDKEGVAVIQGCPTGPCEAVVEAPEYTRWRRAVAAGATEVVVELERGVRIAGVVVDAFSLAPVAGAQVWSKSIGRTTADERGQFTMPVGKYESKRITLVVQAAGYVPTIRYLGSQFRDHLSIQMERSTRVIGSVLDSNGFTLPGAHVRWMTAITDAAYSSEWTTGEVQSDATGHFVLNEIWPNVHYRLDIWSDTGEAASVSVGPFGLKTQAVLSAIPLSSLHTIEGIVQGLGTPGATAILRLARLDSIEGLQGDGLQPSMEVETDDRGHFVVAGVPPGSYSVAITAVIKNGEREEEERGSLVVEIEESDKVKRVVLHLNAEPSVLNGKVTNLLGEPLNEVRVTMLEPVAGNELGAALTSRDGTFRVSLGEDVPGAETSLEAVDLLGRCETKRMTVPHVEANSFVRIVMDDFTGTISGYLLDEEGMPVTTCEIAFRAEDNGLWLSRVAIPDGSGWFEMKNLRDTAFELRLVEHDGEYKPAHWNGVEVDQGPLKLQVGLQGSPGGG